jgi:glycosyltransferase involved in cell wall biosynthesis
MKKSLRNKMTSNLKIAWLTPPRKNQFGNPGSLLYWEPLFEAFQKSFPNTIFFTTGNIHPHYKRKFDVVSIGSSHKLRTKSSNLGYGSTVTLLSPAIILRLIKLKPKLVISSEFNLWTLLAVLLKPLGKWKVILLREGSSPSVDYKKSTFRLNLRKWISKRVDHFITNSKKSVNYLHLTLNVPKKKISKVLYEIPNIENLLEGPADVFSNGKFPKFLYVGALIPRKGVNYLLDAWSKLQVLSEKTGSLWIVGDGPYKSSLMQQANKLKLKNIHFIGNARYSSIGHWYNFSDVFVFPTLEDIWANVTREAMAFGKPILCSKYDGNIELIQPGKNGFIFDPRDSDDLANLMFKFINHPDLAIRLGKKSRDIMSKFDHGNTLKSFSDIINNFTRTKER